MELSELDLNKYDIIIKFKGTLPECVEDATSSLRLSSADKAVNEYGDTVVNKILQHQKRLTDEEITDIITAYQNGKTTYELADEYGCNRNAISSNLKKHGITVYKDKATAKLDIEQVSLLYTDKNTVAQIAKRFHVSSSTILRCLRNQKIQLRSRWDY